MVDHSDSKCRGDGHCWVDGEDCMCNCHPSPYSPEMTKLAEEALKRLEARKNEDVKEWAKKLGKDLADAGEYDFDKHYENKDKDKSQQ